MPRTDIQLMRWKARASKTISILVWLLLSACLVAIFSGDFQGDLRVFHAAPLALDRHVNPYGMPSLLTEIPLGYCYLYPPMLLYAFKPLGAVSLDIAMSIWFCSKLVALALLLRLWHRNFERLSFAWPTVLFLMLGFNSTILLDLASGNIASFESLGLWGAFALILHGRPYLAGVIIAVLSQFKLSPVLFLGLLPWVGPARSWKPLVVSSVLFACLLALNPLLMPEMTGQFLHSLWGGNPNLNEHGQINPSTLSFLRVIFDFGAQWGLPSPRLLADTGYLLIVAILLLAFVWFVRRYADKLRNADQRWLIYLACVLYALVVPRMKDYSYILLLMPALHVVRHTGVQAVLPLVAAMVLLPGHSTYVPGFERVFALLHSYLPWFTAWVLLYYVAREISMSDAFVMRPSFPNSGQTLSA